jgi:hypothetical protein
MSASLAIAFLKSKLTNTISYLESKLIDLKNDQYALGIITYALLLAQSHHAEKARRSVSSKENYNVA